MERLDGVSLWLRHFSKDRVSLALAVLTPLFVKMHAYRIDKIPNRWTKIGATLSYPARGQSARCDGRFACTQRAGDRFGQHPAFSRYMSAFNLTILLEKSKLPEGNQNYRDGGIST
jgi:hypothetical protein